MYLTLKPQFILCGWSNLEYAIYDLDCRNAVKKVYPLNKAQLETLELITSPRVDSEDNILPSALRKYAQKMFEKGFLAQCDKNTGLFEYQKFHTTKAKYIHTLLWSITGNCNLKCRHYYISSGENHYGEISFEECRKVVKQMADANVYSVALTGGEPLVRKDFWKIVDLLIENNIRIHEIFTNGMLINENFLDQLEKRRIVPLDFALSYDGVNCHDWLRGVKGSEEKAINAIRLLKSRGYKVVVSMSIHMGNIDSLIETYELMKKLKVDFWKAVPIIDTGSWKKQKEKSIDIKYIFDKYLELIKLYIKDNKPFDLGLGGFFQAKSGDDHIETPFFNDCSECEKCTQPLCESIKLFPYLLPNGQVLPCISMSGSSMESIAPNILYENQSLEKALSESPVEHYTQNTYKDLFSNNKECNECGYKYKCSGCRANALANGDFFAKDPLACCFIKGDYFNKIKSII